MVLLERLPDPLSVLVERYTKLQQMVKDRRDRWHRSVRNLIEEELRRIVDENRSIGWNQSTSGKANFETVILDIGRSCSGVQRIDGKGGSYMRQGGMLSFSQSTDGRVATFVSFPHIEDLEDPVEVKLLKVMEPQEVDNEMVQLCVSKFLEDLINFETNSKAQIGFKP